MSVQKAMTKNSIIVASILAISAIFGFIRESSIAFMFGASGLTDAYFIAMIIPNLFIGVVKGSVANTFITVYSGYISSEREAEGWRMANIILSTLGIFVFVLVIILSFYTEGIVHLVAPSYKGDQLELTTLLTRILIPSMFFGSLMGIMVGINNAHHSFVAPSLIGLVANIITILAIFILGSFCGIYGLAVGSLLGILAQFIIQIPSAYKNGFRFKFEIDFSNEGFREVMWLVSPFILSAVAVQINMIVNRMLATGLSEGVVSSLYFANKLVLLPQMIFTSAIGMVVYPILTRAASKKDWLQLTEGFQQSIRLLSLVLLPAAMGLYILRIPLVRLLFEHGAFTQEDTIITSGIIIYYVGLLYFGSMVTMVSNIYYALKKMAIAVITGLLAVIVNISLSILLIHPLQHKGLALANTISSFTNLCLLTVGLHFILKKQGIFKNPLNGLGSFSIKVIVGIFGMNFILSRYLYLFNVDALNKFELFLVTLSAILIGVLVYGILIYLFRIEEAQKGIRYLRKRLIFNIFKS